MKQIRKDLYIYNESTGWILTSVGLNGRAEDYIEDGEDWDREFERGTFIPMSLVQDDSLIVRVVVGGELKEQEREEWVDRFTWKLAIPDGKLLLGGSREYLDEPDFDQHDPDSLRVVKVPAGNYHVTVYTLLHSVNGPDEPGGEALPDYWRRTRGRAKMPTWVDEDAEEEEDGEGADARHLLDFIVHLTPLAEEPERPPLEEGWVPVEVNPRKPERCPKGLYSRKVTGLSDRKPYVQTDLNYIHPIPELVAALPLAPIAGGPVEVPLTGLVLPYWIAWCCGETHPYVRITYCPDLPLEWPGFLNGIKETRRDDGWRVDIEGMNARFSQFEHLRILGRVIAGLPEGAVVELAAADNEAGEDEDEEDPGTEGRPGFTRFRGVVSGSEWQIRETYPAIEAETLRSMVALALELEAGGAVTVQSAEEGAAVLADIQARDFLLRQNSPELRGNRLALPGDHLDLLPFLGARVYLQRFGDVWPVMKRDDDLEQWDGAMDKIAQAGAAWATGELVHEGAMANFTLAPPLTETDLASEVKSLDADLVLLGFQPLGDLHTTQTFSTVFRAYAAPDSACYATLFRTFLGRINLDFFNSFRNGWSLTTSNGGGKLDVNEKGTAYRHGADVSTAELLALHETKVAELAPQHAGRVPVNPTLEGFAEAMDEFMVRTLGK